MPVRRRALVRHHLGVLDQADLVGGVVGAVTITHHEHGPGPLHDGGHFTAAHARVDARGDGAQPEQGGVDDRVVDARRQAQRHHVTLLHPRLRQEASDPVGGGVPLAEGQGASIRPPGWRGSTYASVPLLRWAASRRTDTTVW